LAVLPWSESGTKVRQRLACLHLVDAAWPDQSDEALLGQLEDWLGQAAQSGDLSRIDCGQLLLGRLTAEQRRRFDRLAPERYQVPTGSRIEIDYRDPAAPVLPVKLQEMFGETTTPRIADGRLTITIHLLSPAGRPLQVTRDLAGFWRTSYFDVRREMKGRYPKHPWPENPLDAAPTRRTKRRA
jgi:ATP-dependent helicase HrpB